MHAQTSLLPLIHFSEPMVWQVSGWLADWSPALLCPLQQQVCFVQSPTIIAWNCRCSIFGTERVIVCVCRMHTFLSLFHNQDLTSVNQLLIVCFHQYAVAKVSKVKFFHCFVLKEHSSWVVLCSVVLCFDLPQTFWVFLWHLRWTKPCFLPELTPASNYRKPPNLLTFWSSWQHAEGQLPWLEFWHNVYFCSCFFHSVQFWILYTMKV